MITSAPLPPREGLGYYVWNLSQYLRSHGHAVQIVTRGWCDKPVCQVVQGITVWRPWFAPLYPVHVHLHGLAVQRLVRRLESEVDLFHLHTPLAPSIRSRRPNAVTVHTPMRGEARAVKIRDLRSLLIRLQIPISACIEQRVLDSAQVIATVSQSVADELSMYRVQRNRIQVVGNGVDTTVFHPSQQAAGAQVSARYILAAGRLDVRKGLRDLIEAMLALHKAYPDVHLYIAGTGPLKADLRALTARLQLGETVHLLGHVDHSRMAELYRGAAVFAHAAHYEGLPTVLLEAMACGKAVVSTAVSGALDVVQDGVNGLLVPPRSPKAMAQALERLLADHRFSVRLGTDARQTIEHRFSWQVVGQRYVDCYQGLVEQASS